MRDNSKVTNVTVKANSITQQPVTVTMARTVATMAITKASGRMIFRMVREWRFGRMEAGTKATSSKAKNTASGPTNGLMAQNSKER